MHERIMAERNSRAQTRLIEAARKLGQELGLSEQVTALEAVSNRDPHVAALQQREAMAGLLEAVVVKLTHAVESEAKQPSAQTGATAKADTVNAPAAVEQELPKAQKKK